MQRGKITWIEYPSFAPEWKIWNYEVVVFLWRLSIDIIFCVIFHCNALLDLLWLWSIYGRQLISVEEDFQPVVSLPERNVVKTELFEASEVVIRSFVIPLRTSCIPVIHVSAAMTKYFCFTYCVNFFTLGAIDGTT